ncbi:hypothetical protein VNO77_10261 [Canavalia gladiata]|uniref:BTB domain-containing protein n=1 Tax=Canavalia gladiata TaxID=3824 RepID=A0AAN9MDW1_CANGL
MPPRRLTVSAMARPRGRDSDDESNNDNILRCLSCQEEYDTDDLGTCRECYLEVHETEEDLKSQIEDLKSKLSFLKLPSPILNPYSTDLILLPADEPSPAPIPAHKSVLVSRSPVFKAMLENDMTESRSGTIKISDVSFDTLRAFINYLYTAEAPLDNQLACNLLVLGEKYQVKHLKAHCEQHLIAGMNWDKAIENYAFAYQYNCKQLQQVSLEVIMDNMPSLTQNEYYAVLVDSNPRLIVDIYESYLIKQINSAGGIRL